MIETATGLVLRQRLLTESSLIVHWLTREFGRVATVAKGARRPKSPFGGKLDLFYHAQISFSRSRRSELHTLREVGLIETHSFLRQDLGLLQQAAYGAALIEQTTETETPLPAIYELLRGMLAHLATEPPGPKTILGFELKLLQELGLEPDMEKARLNPGTRNLAKHLTEADWAGYARLIVNEAQTKELRQFLHGFLIFHLGKIPESRAAALRG